MDRFTLRPSLPTVGLVCLAGFAGLLVLLHIFAFIFDDMPAFISQFVVRPHGWLFPVGMLFFIAGTTAIALALRDDLAPSRQARIARILFAAIALCGIVVAIFPTDRGTTLSLYGTIHAIAAVPTFLLLTCLMFVLALAFRQDPRWQGLAPISLGLGLLVTFVLIGVVLGFSWGKEVAGMFQRVAAVLDGVWLMMVGLRARRIRLAESQNLQVKDIKVRGRTAATRRTPPMQQPTH